MVIFINNINNQNQNYFMTTKFCIYNVQDIIAKIKIQKNRTAKHRYEQGINLRICFFFFDFDYDMYQKHTAEGGSPAARINIKTERFLDLIDLSVQLADFKFVNLDMLTKVVISAMRLNKAFIDLFYYRK